MSPRINRIIENDAQTASLKEIADILCMSERTIRRKLALEGTSFRELVESKKKRYAINYLKDVQYNISEIASKLGFCDTASFCKAFNKWEGMTPKTYRNKMLNISETS